MRRTITQCTTIVNWLYIIYFQKVQYSKYVPSQVNREQKTRKFLIVMYKGKKTTTTEKINVVHKT
jgi:hypothetical protein